MRKHLISVLIAAAVVGGCKLTNPADDASPAMNMSAVSNAAAGTAMPLKELMGHVMQRNATQLWAWTAYVSDAQGDRYTSPRTEAEWLDAESDAMTMQVLINALLDPAYRVDDEWPRHVETLAQAFAASADAAEHKNFAGMLKASDQINAACVACHMAYVPELEGVQPQSRLSKSIGDSANKAALPAELSR